MHWRARLDCQIAHERSDAFHFSLFGKPERGHESSEVRKGHVVANRKLLHQAKTLAVFWNQHHTELDAFSDRFVADYLTGETDFAGSLRMQSHQAFEEFGSTC